MVTVHRPDGYAESVPSGCHRDSGRWSRPVLGMLTGDLTGLHATQWLGAVDAARAHGCDLICFSGRALAEPGFRRQANAVYDLVTADTVDGLIIWTSLLAVNIGVERTLEFCRRFAPLPIVSVEQPLGPAPVVRMDDRRGMYAAVSHLIEVHGRREIAFIRGPATHEGAGERYRGYRDALADHGLDSRPGRVSAPLRSWSSEEAAASVARMLAEHRRTPPDGIVAANDDLAVGVLSALVASGVRTPDDIAIVGFDDCANVRPHFLGFNTRSDDEPARFRSEVNVDADSLSFTTVRAPFHEMGERSVELALRLVRGETVPAVVDVPTSLVIRRSCGCFPTAARDVSAGPVVPAGSVVPERPTSQLRRTLTRQSSHLPDDWPERLSTEFVRAVRGDGPRAGFLRLLDQFAQASLGAGEQAANWSQALATLRRLVGDAASADQVARAEDLSLHAQMLLNECVERHWRYAQVLAEKRDQIVGGVGQRLITASDVGGLADVLAEDLAKVEIPGCYLAAYESVMSGTDAVTGTPVADVRRDRSRLLLAYENGARADITPDHAVFGSGQLVPGGRLNRATPYSVVAAPLYFRDEQLGFVLFELGPSIGWIYVSLQEHISTALHRALMVERERRTYAAMQEVHRREERHRLAGELHDSVSQALFSMTLHTRAMQLALQQSGDGQGAGGSGRSRVARGLDELRELTQSALSDMRSLIFQLRPDALRDEGLVEVVRRHAAGVAARENLDVQVHAPEDRLPLDERAEEDLLRVVQEALHNIVKHARASRVRIRLVEPADAAGTLVVEVADDGVGFDPDVAHPGHLGLDTMRERTLRLGGRLTVESSPAGSTVRAVLPGVLATGSS
jgi:signal transduction histidine kinase/DNA-binding LacI/PurR family transcriptional regulator